MSQWDFTPTFDNPNQTEWAPKPAPAAAPAAPAAPADVPPSLEGGPSYLAFQKALGLQRSNAERTSQQTIDSINQQKPITEQWLGRNNDLANKQINGAMESRGLYRSGETGTHLADQAAAYGHSLSALDADTQNRIAAIQQALATQETGFDAQDIVAKQDSADRQQLAKAQGDIQQQLLDALAKGQTLPDLSTLLPGGVTPTASASGTLSASAPASLARFNLSPSEAYVVSREDASGNPTARNPQSGAFGIGQLNPSSGTLQSISKELGVDPYTTDPATQVAMMRRYIADRYGSADAAAAHERQFGWY